VCLQGTSREVFIGSQGQSCGKSCARGSVGEGLADRPSLRGEPTSLPHILSCHHMERYSHGGLNPAGCKVGSVGQGVSWPATLLGPPGKGFGLRGPHYQKLTVVTFV
jgi:hypothetical protein